MACRTIDNFTRNAQGYFVLDRSGAFLRPTAFQIALRKEGKRREQKALQVVVARLQSVQKNEVASGHLPAFPYPGKQATSLHANSNREYTIEAVQDTTQIRAIKNNPNAYDIGNHLRASRGKRIIIIAAIIFVAAAVFCAAYFGGAPLLAAILYSANADFVLIAVTILILRKKAVQHVINDLLLMLGITNNPRVLKKVTKMAYFASIEEVDDGLTYYNKKSARITHEAVKAMSSKAMKNYLKTATTTPCFYFENHAWKMRG